MDGYTRMLRQMNPPKDPIILLFSFMKRKLGYKGVLGKERMK